MNEIIHIEGLTDGFYGNPPDPNYSNIWAYKAGYSEGVACAIAESSKQTDLFLEGEF